MTDNKPPADNDATSQTLIEFCETQTAMSMGEKPHRPEHCDKSGRPHRGPCFCPDCPQDDPAPVPESCEDYWQHIYPRDER